MPLPSGSRILNLGRCNRFLQNLQIYMNYISFTYDVRVSVRVACAQSHHRSLKSAFLHVCIFCASVFIINCKSPTQGTYWACVTAPPGRSRLPGAFAPWLDVPQLRQSRCPMSCEVAETRGRAFSRGSEIVDGRAAACTASVGASRAPRTPVIPDARSMQGALSGSALYSGRGLVGPSVSRARKA